MSQSGLRPTKKGEEVYVELQDDGGFNIAWGAGMTERQAADLAEQRWRRTFGRGVRPTRKAVVVRKTRVMSMLPAGTRNPDGEPVMR
jgi:hypothetical protein